MRDLIATKAPQVLASRPKGGQGWTVTYAMFTRSGLTEAAAQELAAHQGLAVDLHRLMADRAEETAGGDSSPLRMTRGRRVIRTVSSGATTGT